MSQRDFAPIGLLKTTKNCCSSRRTQAATNLFFDVGLGKFTVAVSELNLRAPRLPRTNRH